MPCFLTLCVWAYFWKIEEFTFPFYSRTAYNGVVCQWYLVLFFSKSQWFGMIEQFCAINVCSLRSKQRHKKTATLLFCQHLQLEWFLWENNSCHPVTLEWFSTQILANSEISKLSCNLSLTHLRAEIECYELKGDLSPGMFKEIFHNSLKIRNLQGFIWKTIQVWLGSKKCFSHTNPSTFR